MNGSEFQQIWAAISEIIIRLDKIEARLEKEREKVDKFPDPCYCDSAKGCNCE